MVPSPTDESMAPTPPVCTAPHVDGCEECIVNIEPPQFLERSDAGCVGHYICSDCGHVWTTTWSRC